MSFQAMTWATEQRLPSLQKLVLLMLANRTNHDTGECFPSHARLAEECGMSKDSVKRSLQALEDRGLIEIRRQTSHGVNLPNTYRLNMHRVGADSTQGRCCEPPGVGADSTQGRCCEPPGVGADSPPNQEVEPIREPISPPYPPKAFKPEEFEIPHWLPQASWAEWCQHRREIRHPLTAPSCAQTVSAISEIRESGGDWQGAINRSIANRWRGIFNDKRSTTNHVKPNWRTRIYENDPWPSLEDVG